VARLALGDEPVTSEELSHHGTGLYVDPQREFTLLMMHPTTTHPENAEMEWYKAFVLAKNSLRPVIAFWPGADAGMDAISKMMREMHIDGQAKVIRTMPPRRFLKLLSQATYAVGNSSALIREASYFGIPRTIIGDRQRGREWTPEASHMYGDGHAAPRIADICGKAAGVRT
jgi:bifunctional UDP-N-acetylglucosamine 2-epimerase / N-acetylmannosamine kinase